MRTCLTVCIIVLWLLVAVVIVVLLYFAINGKFNHNKHKRDQGTFDKQPPLLDTDSIDYTSLHTTVLATRSSVNASLTPHGIKITQHWPITATSFLLNCTANTLGVYAFWSWGQQHTYLTTEGVYNCTTVTEDHAQIDCGSHEQFVGGLADDYVLDPEYLTILFCAQDMTAQVSYNLSLHSGLSNPISTKYVYQDYSRNPAISVCLGGVAIIFLMIYLGVVFLQAYKLN